MPTGFLICAATTPESMCGCFRPLFLFRHRVRLGSRVPLNAPRSHYHNAGHVLGLPNQKRKVGFCTASGTRVGFKRQMQAAATGGDWSKLLMDTPNGAEYNLSKDDPSLQA
jgi:hypothetical protein